MEPQPNSNNKFAPEQSMSEEEWDRLHNPRDEILKQVVEANNLACAKKMYELFQKMKGSEE